MHSSARQRRRRPWEDEDDVATDTTSTAPESTAIAAVKEEVHFAQPSVHHRDAPHLHLETATSQPSESNFPAFEYLTSAASSSPGLKRQRTDYTTSTSGSASAVARSSISYRFSEDNQCCPAGCTGKQCERIRHLSRRLMTEITTHEVLVHGTSEEADKDVGMTTVITDAMEVVVERLSKSNISLKALLDASPVKPSILSKPPEDLDNQSTNESPMMRVSTHPFAQTDPTRRPSLDSMNELQSQIAAKNLKIQALQNDLREVQQRMEHEQTESAELERKYEAADAEVIYLTTEKDRLEQMIVALEKQVKDLEISRNEARKSNSDMASQYLRIVEMAGRLHTRDAGSEAQGPQLSDRETLQSLEEGSHADSNQAKLLMLEQEVKRLRSRNLRLENGAAAAKQATQNVDWILKNALEDSEA